MILTCPKCATQFLVEPADLGPAGRRVRCSVCGEQWRVEAGAEPAAEAAAPDPAPTAEPAPEPILAEDAPFIAPIGRRAPPSPASSARPGWSLGFLVLLVLVVVAVLFAFRREIVQAWPASASLYAAVGLAPPPPAPHG